MKSLLIKIAIFFMKIIYFFMKLFKTKNKVTMISRQSNNMSIDFKMVKEYIESKGKYKVIVLCKTLDGKEKAKLLSLFGYFFHMLKQMYHIATSKVVILDSYCIPVSVLNHKKSLKVIQMWHSIGTMKKFGYDILDQEEGNSSKMAHLLKMHNNYTDVLCAGEGYKYDLVRQFNCKEDVIRIIPLPRLDYITNKSVVNNIKNNIFKDYPILKKKKNIIYVPTFRKEESNLETHLNDLIDNVDYKKYNLIVKLHPLSKLKIKNKNVITASKYSSLDMILVSDYVITDYSCILYEAGVINKALYFYPFDYEEYNKNRSLNIDYFKDLPGVISKNAKDIIKSIENDKYDYNELNKFIKKYVNYNGNSLEKIYELVDKDEKKRK